MKEKSYECPFCNSEITKEKYVEVIRENEILKKKIEGLEKEREQLKVQEAKLKEEKKNFEKRLKDAVNASIIKERQKVNAELTKCQEQIKQFKEKESKFKEQLKQVKANERIKLGHQLTKYELLVRKQKEQIDNLKKGKTAQELGFDFENEMYDILKGEFPEDDVQHTGKKGDAIVKVKDKENVIGTILVECKRVETHKPEHIDEVKRHKIIAKADVGVLVTNGDFGKKSKMDGFKNIDDILVIRPFSAVDFIKYLRKNIIYINLLKMSKEEKNKEMLKLWEFIHSAEFESQMNSILRDVGRLQELDVKELDILGKRKQVEENLLKAHQLITKGTHQSGKKE